MKNMVKFGSGSASWGDNFDPGIELCEKGDIEYIGWDHLAELTMAILIRMRQRNPKAGYVPDMVEIMRLSLPACMKRGIKSITNGGGANPEEGAKEVLKAAKDLGLKGVKIGVVTGDELPLEKLEQLLDQGLKFPNRDTGAPDPREIRNKWVAASVYIGSEGIIDCLKRGANVVIAGRISDNALYVGPLMYEFGWDFKEPYWNRISAGVTAGHIIECAGCCTGNMTTQWRKVVVLKGAYTVVAAPDGRIAVSPFANPGLASAGTGDVLAGAIAGLMAQRLTPFDAAVCGVFLHGKAGEMVKMELGDAGMIASDLLPRLPLAIRQLKDN